MKNRALTLTIMASMVAIVACTNDPTTPVNNVVTFKATLNGAAASPVNTSAGTGTFTGLLDTSTNVFVYSVTFTGLGSNVTSGHFHGPADPGANASTTINFATLSGAQFTTGATSGTAAGSVLLTSATVVQTTSGATTMKGDSLKTLLFAGKTYVDIHTTGIGSGEIRGQITKQ